jgi:hypothetical protein
MQRLLICCVFLLLVNSADAKDGGPPPAGGEALYRWCWHNVIIRYGHPLPVLDSPRQKAMPMTQALGMIDACVQAHGKGYAAN